jgi:branched-subunit amino acid aminotransferase/4-amino-4-deoxychorismate lyase
MTIILKEIKKENLFDNLGPPIKPWHSDYLVMYSSWFDGYVTDPNLMMVPVDDHLVHRGDGVFDVMRCVNGKIYQMEAHLQRLERSAKSVFLTLPPKYSEIRELLKKLTFIGNEKNCIIRIIISRGPGGFSTNPYECPASQMYINVIRLHKPPEQDYIHGIRAVTSRIPIKSPFFATIKSCNYLPNVLMKKEAIDAGCKYSINVDDEGHIGEGSTENICIVSKDGYLKIPGFDHTLAGTTASRIFQLAGNLVKNGMIKGVKFDELSPEDVYHSSEAMLMGTSISLLPLINFDSKVLGSGQPGPVYSQLSTLLWNDMTANKDLLTDVW